MIWCNYLAIVGAFLPNIYECFTLNSHRKNQLSVIIKPEPDLLTRGQNDEVNFMTLFMNEKDMNEMLDSICPEGETYQGKAWGTLMSGTAEMLALGALSNVYCYVGVTEKTLVIAVLETFDISHIYGKICIPFDQFDELKVQKGLLPSQRIIKAKSGKTKIKLSLVNNSITAKIKDQKQGMLAICEALERLKH